MSDRFTIKLALREPGRDRLVLGLPTWYRVLMAAVVALLLAALAQAGGRFGILGWAMLGAALLGLLYRESWEFDAGRARVVRRVGLGPAVQAVVVPLEAVERFLIAPQVDGTIPGTRDESLEHAAALGGGRADDGALRRARHKKAYLALVMECRDGVRHLLDRVPARDAARLRWVAASLGELCARPVADAEA
jgi:hypothetical protein